MAEPRSDDPDESRQEFLPAIRRARVEELRIYEVSEAELDLLERGAPDSILLNFAIALISMALSLSVTFATASIESIRTFCVLVILTVAGYIAGAVLAVLWWTNRRSVTSVSDRIRKRLPPPGGQTET